MSAITLEANTKAVVKKNTAIDFIKVLVAFGVVLTHVKFSNTQAKFVQDLFNPFHVPFFFVSALTFFVAGLSRGTLQDIFTKAWMRIALPYLAWTIIYAGLLLTKILIVGGTNNFIFWKMLFYGESAVHLYFLPELLILQLLSLSLFLIFTGENRKRVIGFVFFAIAISYLGWGYFNQCFGVPSPYYIMAYLTSAFLLASKVKSTIVQWKYLVLGFILLSLAAFIQWIKIDNSIILFAAKFPVGGIGLLLIAIGFPFIRLPARLLYLSMATFGIYLSHVLFLEAFEFFCERILAVEVYYNLETKLAVTTSIFIFSIVFVLFIQKIPMLKQILLGEKG